MELSLWDGRVVRSPAGLLGIRGEWSSQGWGATLNSAFWREELGQWRPHGVGPLRQFVLADIDTRLGFQPRESNGANPVQWLGNRARLLEYVTVAHVPESPWLAWLQRLGWGLELASEVGPLQSTVQLRFDGYALWLDGTTGAWLLGVRAGLLPAARIRGDRGVQASVVGEAFARRRLRAIGQLKLAVTATQTWQRLDAGVTALGTALSVHLPWGDRESWWTQLSASADCDAQLQCRAQGSVGVAF